MSNQLTDVKWGLALVLLGLLFGIALGVYFGVNEDAVQAYIANGIAAHPALHDAHSQDKIWRLVQRAHFHATGIGAFSLSLLLLVAMCDLMPMLKKAASTLIGLSAYPDLCVRLGRRLAFGHGHPFGQPLSAPGYTAEARPPSLTASASPGQMGEPGAQSTP